nr:AMP-dependent synthetase and ligase [uncultured bacterium]
MIYTSGSTGRPTGVAIEHHSPVTLLDWAATLFTAEELSGVLASTSICFDLSIFELFLPLSCGGTVLLVEDALALVTLPGADEVTLINTVPSAMAELVRLRAVPQSVRTVNLAGEALAKTLVEEVYRTARVERVYNLYGPSEATTYSTWSRVEQGMEGKVKIGVPVSGTQAYVLDRWMKPVVEGGYGEIYLGGEGLARGYLQRAVETAERFVPHPFSEESGRRLYRTGDVGRWSRGGELEYVGRVDEQVKLRGYRIELGEVEAVLREQPAIAEAVVIVRSEAEGIEQRIVAYLVMEEEERGMTTSELRQRLKERLPEYMIPSAFVMLDELPLTPNGKVNRRALPSPEGLRPGLKTDYVAPQTEVERKIAAIWHEILQVKEVGIHDNFFDLGGHSLLMVRVHSKIQETFETKISIVELFKSPTVSALAQRLTRQESRQTSAEQIHERARKQREAISAQQRLMAPKR